MRYPMPTPEFQAVVAENERLRAALEELATLGEEGMKPDYGEWLTFHDKVAKVARGALNQQRTDGK